MNKKNNAKLSAVMMFVTLFSNINVEAATKKTNATAAKKTTIVTTKKPVIKNPQPVVTIPAPQVQPQPVVTVQPIVAVQPVVEVQPNVFINDNLQKAFQRGTSLIIESGTYSISSIKQLSNNITVEGNINTIIDGNNTGSFSIEGLKNVEFKNITFTNLTEMYFKNATNLKFTNCKFTNFKDNGIVIDTFNNVEFTNSTISNIGSTELNITWQGMGMYLVNGNDLKVNGTEINNTYGHAGIFLINTKNIEIKNNNFHDTFYRAIELFNDGNSGIISNNNMYNMGSINTTDSGVGCNAIFADGNSSEVDVVNNNISNVIENGIEGTFKSVNYNTIVGTGIDMINHPTPSGEGIYGATGQYVGNVIKNSYGPGIKIYSEEKVSDLIIKENFIYKSVDSDFAININSEIGYSNLDISANKSYDNNYSVFVKKRSSVKLNVNANLALGSNVLGVYVNN